MTAPQLGRKQLDSYRECTAPINLWNGAVSSGKTFISSLAWARYVASAPPGPLAMIGKTHTTLERNVLDPLTDMLPAGAIQHTRGAVTATILGRLVHVLGANDRRAEDRIRGLTLAGAYVDEATLLPPGYWDMLNTRLRVPGARLFATTNPDHPRHPLKLAVIDKAAAEGYRVWFFTMDDNPGLDPDYVRRQKRMYAGLFYRRFILGEWVAASGAIYDMLNLGTDTEHGPHKVPADDVILDGVYRIGADYGTANATHVVLLAKGRRRSTGREAIFVVGEWCYSGRDSGRSLTDAEQSRHLRHWLATGGRDPGPGHTGQPVAAWSTVRREVTPVPEVHVERWSVDPAAASFKTQLRRDGLTGVRDANNAVVDGLRLVGSLIAEQRLLFVDGAAPVLEGQLLGYVWDDDPAVDEPAKGQEDHGCDGLRYGVQGSRDWWRPWLTAHDDPEPERPAADPTPGRHRLSARHATGPVTTAR